MKLVYSIRTLLVAFALVAMAATASAQGKIEIVGGDTYDWGTVSPGELTTTVQIKNTAKTGNLHISRIQPGCGCTVTSQMDKDTIKPGEIGKFGVKIDMRNRDGAQHKIITVYSSDTSNPNQIVNLKANIKPLIKFVPAQYYLINDAKVGTETASSIKIVNSSDAPYTIFPPELVSINNNTKVRFDMTKKKELKPGEEQEIKVYVTPGASGSMNGTVRVKTSNAQSASVDLMVYGNVAPNETATPAQSSSKDATPKQIKN